MTKFHVGQRVELPANKKEGWSREVGTVVECTTRCLTVQVDEAFRSDHADDGLREMSPKDARPLVLR